MKKILQGQNSDTFSYAYTELVIGQDVVKHNYYTIPAIKATTTNNQVEIGLNTHHPTPTTHHHKLLDNLEAKQEAQLRYSSLLKPNQKKYEETNQVPPPSCHDWVKIRKYQY